MSLDRFQNKEQVLGYTPVFGETIPLENLSDIVKIPTYISLGDITGEIDTNTGLVFTPNQELHIYADSNLIKSSYGNVPKYLTKGSNPTIYTQPELDLRLNGIQQGAYSMVYNFLFRVIPDAKIFAISSDRTEVKLVSKNNVPDSFKPLLNLINSVGVNSFDTSGVKKDIVINFGSNDLYDVYNLEFDGTRVGIVNETLTYPGSVFDGTPTKFVPFDGTFEGGVDLWRTMVEVYVPAINQPQTNFGKLTGRFRKYKLQQNSNGVLVWIAGQRTFTTPPDDLDIKEPNLKTAIQNDDDVFATINRNDLQLEYRRFDNTVTLVNNVILKLSTPLASNIEVGDILNIDARIMKSWVEKIVAFPSIQNQSRPDFSDPNFGMDMSDQVGAEGTNWQNWNSLLDVNATTSQQLINYYFSGSLGSTKLNIDYSDFQNFVHFSSATERVDNFVYKLQQIEAYDSRINTLQSVSGSEALTNISQSIIRKDRIIGGFDDFEHYLYYNTTSNLYTHWSSSAYTIEPYPKASTFPHVLRETNSIEGSAWYSGVYSSASLYDNFNDAKLRNMIPIHLQEDEKNSEYITFVDMIGQHFDIQWTYIKSLTDINRREEHPKDGMADEILKSVAEALGWKLSNGYSDVSLWKYALGVESDGTLSQTGSMETKARKQITEEIWRRILNTLPMLYKTKGTARSIKAILSTYGIPQAFLKIREWGGPTISTRKNVYEHERFVNKLQASPSKYISNPWDDIQSDRPNSIEVIGKMPKGNYHILRLTDSSNNVDYFWDYNTAQETARIRLAVNGTDIISSSYVPYKLRRDAAFVLTSGSIDIQAAWVDDWGNLLANPTATFSGTNATFNTVWSSTGTLQVPGPTTDSNVNSYETASIQEIRYFRDAITNEITTEHAKNREAYFSDDNTTDLDIDTSFDKLMYRIFPDSSFATTSSYIRSIQPNQKFTTTDSGLPLTASLINMGSGDLVGEVDTQFVTVPSMGALNLMNNKIRIESASLKGKLNPDKSNEISEYDYAPLDSNLLGTYFSTTDTVNFDIYNSEGYFEADDWVGDPDKRYNNDYPLLKFRAKNYFQKYTTGTAIDLILDMLSRYDMSVFEQIKQLLPARVDWHKGILIEPHIFERSKYRRPRDISYTRHMYDGTISNVGGVITASRHDYSSSLDLYDFQPSTYQYQIATLSSSLSCSLSTTNTSVSASVYSNLIDSNEVYIIYQSASYNAHSLDFFTSSADWIYNEENLGVFIDNGVGGIQTPSASIAQITNLSPGVYQLEIDAQYNIHPDFDTTQHSFTLSILEDSAAPKFGVFTSSSLVQSCVTLDESGTYVNRTNGYWEYSPTGSTVLKARLSKWYLEPKYFFTSSEDAATLTPNSTSFHYAEVQDTRLPLALENLYYNGCRISSDSLTTDSEDTPDGGPVVEITEVDSTTLVYSGKTAADGNLTNDGIVTGPVRKVPDDLLVSVNNKKKKNKNSAVNVASLQSSLEPLPFIVRNSKPKANIIKNDTNSIYAIEKSISNRFKIYKSNFVYYSLEGWQFGDWKSLTQLPKPSYRLSVNGVDTTNAIMGMKNTIRINDFNPTSTAGSLRVINQVFLTQVGTGQIIWNSAYQLNVIDYSFQVGSYPFDVEIRVILST